MLLFATPQTYKQPLDVSDSGNVTVNVWGFILTWDLMNFLIYPGERGTYQMSLMRSF